MRIIQNYPYQKSIHVYDTVELVYFSFQTLAFAFISLTFRRLLYLIVPLLMCWVALLGDDKWSVGMWGAVMGPRQIGNKSGLRRSKNGSKGNRIYQYVLSAIAVYVCSIGSYKVRNVVDNRF